MNKLKKELKNICKNISSGEELNDKLLERFEQITDQPAEKGYAKKYDICRIISDPKIKIKTVFSKKINERESIVFEKINYEEAPKGYILFLNLFLKNEQLKFIMYV